MNLSIICSLKDTAYFNHYSTGSNSSFYGWNSWLNYSAGSLGADALLLAFVPVPLADLVVVHPYLSRNLDFLGVSPDSTFFKLIFKVVFLPAGLAHPFVFLGIIYVVDVHNFPEFFGIILVLAVLADVFLSKAWGVLELYRCRLSSWPKIKFIRLL